MSFKDLLKEFMDNPEVIAIQKELNDFVTKEYSNFNSTEFCGEAENGAVKIYYCYSKGEFFRTEINCPLEIAINVIHIAINDALKKHDEAYKKFNENIAERQVEYYKRMVEIAQKLQNVDVPSLVNKPKKNYLN